MYMVSSSKIGFLKNVKNKSMEEEFLQHEPKYFELDTTTKNIYEFQTKNTKKQHIAIFSGAKRKDEEIWFFIPLKKVPLKKLLAKKITLIDFLKNYTEVIIGYKKLGNLRSVRKVEFAKIPKTYLPKNGVYLNFELKDEKKDS